MVIHHFSKRPHQNSAGFSIGFRQHVHRFSANNSDAYETVKAIIILLIGLTIRFQCATLLSGTRIRFEQQTSIMYSKTCLKRPLKIIQKQRS